MQRGAEEASLRHHSREPFQDFASENHGEAGDRGDAVPNGCGRRSSMFTLTTRARSPSSADTSSTIGDIMRHGPHHGAQKSTSTGTADWKISGPNVLSVRLMQSWSFNVLLNRFIHRGTDPSVVIGTPVGLQCSVWLPTLSGRRRPRISYSAEPNFMVEGFLIRSR